MGRPQKDDVYKLNLAGLSGLPAPIRAAGRKLEEEAGKANSTVHGLDWKGAAKNAAGDRIDREQRQDRKVADAYEKWAKACEDGAKAMEPMRATLKSDGQALEKDNYDVSQNWDVTDKYNYEAGKTAMMRQGASEEDATNRMNQLKKDRENHAATEQTRLQRLADELGVASDNTKNAIAAARGDMASAAPLAAGLTGTQGKTDFSDLPQGIAFPTGDPAALARLVAAGTLSPEQLATLERGGKVEIGAGQMGYLYQLAQSLNGKTPGEIAMLTASMPPEAKAALAQGLKIVSNPNVQVAGADQIKPYAKGATDETRGTFTPVSGSLVNLPNGVVKELTRTDRVTQEPSRGFTTTHLNGVGALHDTSVLLSPGASISGSEATKAMLAAATQYAAVDVQHSEGLVHGLKSDVGSALLNAAGGEKSLSSALADIYHVAGSDRVAVHDMVTGDGGDKFLRTITHEQFGADSGKVGEVFKWMQDGSNPLATDTASKVAHWMADNKPDLNAMPGTEKLFMPGGEPKSFAEVNPGLAKAMAEGISPYLADLAQAPIESGLTHPGIDPFKNGGDLQNLFSVFDKSADSAGVINDAAYRQYQHLIENSGQPGLHGNQAEIAGRLTNAMTDGALDSIRPGSSSNEELFKSIFGKIPGAGTAFDAADFFKQIQDGKDPSAFAQQLATAGTSSTALRASILNGMIETNPAIANDPTLRPYIRDGRIDLSGLDSAGATRAMSDLKNYFTEHAKGVDVEIATDVTQGNNDNWSVTR